MDWGWIVLIAVLVLLALPLFVPVIVRVRARSEVKEFEYSVGLGPFTLLPDFEANFAHYKRKIGRPLYYISRPVVWLFILLFLVFRAIIWPFQRVAGLFRRKPSMLRSESEIRQPGDDIESTSTVFRFDEESDEYVDLADSRYEESSVLGEMAVEEVDESETVTTPSSSEVSEADLDSGDRPQEWDSSDAYSSDESVETSDGFESGVSFPESQRQGGEQSGSSLWSKLRQAKAGYDKGMDMLHRYGHTGKRAVRAVLLFAKECVQALSFPIFELRWSVGGDPAALGQIIGWHHMLTGMLDPRVQRHVHFDPQWDSEPLSPSGQANVVLYVWPYRFIPPIMRLLFRMPWWGLIRVAREQIFKRK